MDKGKKNIIIALEISVTSDEQMLYVYPKIITRVIKNLIVFESYREKYMLCKTNSEREDLLDEITNESMGGEL